MTSPSPRRRHAQHFDVPGHAHYLTFSCWERRPFLARDLTRDWLCQAIEAARSQHRFDLWAYVIMPEHVHLLILPAPSSRIGVILRRIKEPLARRAVQWVRQNAPDFLETMQDRQPSGRRSSRFWLPGGGYDRNIWTAQELHEKIGYIHANPVRRGLVDSLGGWGWSSYRAWEEGIDEPLRIDRESLPPMGA